MKKRQVIAAKTAVHFLVLLPALWLLWQGWLMLDFQDHALTVNPIQYINQYTGDWTIRLILLGLAFTPLRKITGWKDLARFRRMIGLYACLYAALHLMNFMILDHYFDWSSILNDILKRKAITFGMIAFVLLIPLALTSTKAMIRRLGKSWLKLHRLVYAIAILAVIHNMMMVKADLFEPTLHAAILIFLLGYRFYRNISGKFKTSKRVITQSEILFNRPLS